MSFACAYALKLSALVVELARPRLCIAIPVNDPLALAEPLALGDLTGKRIRIPERGNPYVDAARERIAQHAAGIEFIEFPHYDIRVFDECAQCGDLLLSKEIWRGVHPFMQTMEAQWDLVEPYCLYFAKHPRPCCAIRGGTASHFLSPDGVSR